MRWKWEKIQMIHWDRKILGQLRDIGLEVFKCQLIRYPVAAMHLMELRHGIVGRDCVGLLAQEAECKGTPWTKVTPEMRARLDILNPEKWVKRAGVLWACSLPIPLAGAFLTWLTTPYHGSSMRKYMFIALCVGVGLIVSLVVNWLCRVEPEDTVIRRILKMDIEFFEDPSPLYGTFWVWRVQFLRFWLFPIVGFVGFVALVWHACYTVDSWHMVYVWTQISAVAAAKSHHDEVLLRTADLMDLGSPADERQPFGASAPADNHEIGGLQ
jgi:hypothetical protein